MTYSTGASIVASDFNAFLATVNSVYGSGQGDRGYGQTALAMSPVRPNTEEVADLVLAEQWAKLRQMIMVCANHQGTNLSSLAAAPLFGQTTGVVAGLAAATATVDTNRNIAAVNSMTLASNLYTVVRSTTWLGAMTTVVDVSFQTEDHARYFFNSGGEIRMRLTHPSGSSGQDQTLRSALTAEIGTIKFKSGSSSVTGNTTDHTSYGYYTLNDTPRPMIDTTFSDYGFGGTTIEKNTFSVTVQRLYHSPLSTGNGTTIRFVFNMDSGHMCATGTKLDFDIFRATAYLTGISAPAFMDISSGWVGGNGTDEPVGGTGSDTFSFNFEDVTNAEPSTTITSSPITIPTIESGYLVASVTAPAALSVNGGAFAQSVEVSAGNTLRVRQVSSSANATALTTTVTIGPNVDPWVITTRAADATPTGSDIFPIDLGSLTGKLTDTVYESNVVTIPTLASPTLLGYIGNGVGKMSVRKNGGAWSDYFEGTGTAPSFYVASGDTVQVRVQTGSEVSHTYGRFLFIGPNNGQFTVSTSAGAGNDAFYFSFNDVVDSQTNTLITSDPITIPLLSSVSLPASVTTGANQAALSVNGGTWASTANVSSGSMVRVRALSPATTGTTVAVPVSIGANSDVWSVTTAAASVGAMVVGNDVEWGTGDNMAAGTLTGGTSNHPIYQSNFSTSPMDWEYPSGIQAGDMLIYAMVGSRFFGRIGLTPPPGFTALGLGEQCRGRDQTYHYGYKIATGNETGSVGARHMRGYATGGMVAIRGFTSVAYHDFDYEADRHQTPWDTDVDPQPAAYLYWAFPVHPGVIFGAEPKNPTGFEKSYVLNENVKNRKYPFLSWLFEKHGGGLGVRFNDPNEAKTTMSWKVGPSWFKHGIVFKVKLH